jgi:hypothetical protein
MNAVTEKTPQTVRTLIHQKVDEATDAELSTIHRMLLELEVRRLWGELGTEFAEDWASGQLTAENVAEAVQTHRAGTKPV